MIEFRCINCGWTLRVRRIYAGKKGKCPKCKTVLTVPQHQVTSGESDVTDADRTEAGLKDSPYDLTLLDVPKGGPVKWLK